MTVEIVEGTELIEPLPFTEGEYQRRISGLRAAMTERGLEAFISFTPENIYYVTAHDTPGYYFYQGCVVTHDQPPVNVLRQVETSNTLSRTWSRRVVAYGDLEDPSAFTLELLHELGVADKRIGMEAGSWFVTPKQYAQLQQGIEKAGGEVEDATGLIEALRVIKSEEELAYTRAGARAAEAAMRAAVGATREGTDENEIAAATLTALVRAGGEYSGLPPFVATGPRTALCHATWSGRVVEQGDMINFELPGVIKRYAACIFRCGTVGPPDDELVRLSECMIDTLENVISAIRPGRNSHDVHMVHRETYAKHGFEDLLGNSGQPVGISQRARRTAYSLGVNYPPDWGEGHIMSIQHGDERPLRPGMVFHVTPGVCLIGRYSMVISDTVLVTDDGCEVVTDFPRPLFVA